MTQPKNNTSNSSKEESDYVYSSPVDQILAKSFLDRQRDFLNHCITVSFGLFALHTYAFKQARETCEKVLENSSWNQEPFETCQNEYYVLVFPVVYILISLVFILSFFSQYLISNTSNTKGRIPAYLLLTVHGFKLFISLFFGLSVVGELVVLLKNPGLEISSISRGVTLCFEVLGVVTLFMIVFAATAAVGTVYQRFKIGLRQSIMREKRDS